jgi:hypothetical protein
VHREVADGYDDDDHQDGDDRREVVDIPRLLRVDTRNPRIAVPPEPTIVGELPPAGAIPPSFAIGRPSRGRGEL